MRSCISKWPSSVYDGKQLFVPDASSRSNAFGEHVKSEVQFCTAAHCVFLQFLVQCLLDPAYFVRAVISSGGQDPQVDPLGPEQRFAARVLPGEQPYSGITDDLECSEQRGFAGDFELDELEMPFGYAKNRTAHTAASTPSKRDSGAAVADDSASSRAMLSGGKPVPNFPSYVDYQ